MLRARGLRLRQGRPLPACWWPAPPLTIGGWDLLCGRCQVDAIRRRGCVPDGQQTPASIGPADRALLSAWIEPRWPQLRVWQAGRQVMHILNPFIVLLHLDRHIMYHPPCTARPALEIGIDNTKLQRSLAARWHQPPARDDIRQLSARASAKAARLQREVGCAGGRPASRHASSHLTPAHPLTVRRSPLMSVYHATPLRPAAFATICSPRCGFASDLLRPTPAASAPAAWGRRWGWDIAGEPVPTPRGLDPWQR